jgi:hypothetical protein
MARLRLTIGGAVPVTPGRPPLVMGGSFVVAATASKVDGLGQAALAIGGSLTAYAAQALRGTFTVSAGAKLRADLSGAFVVSAGSDPTAWPNGYLYRRRLTLAAQSDLTAETVTDFPAFLDSTEVPGDWSWLVTANGKLLSVSVSTPRDIRFETEGGTKLDHFVEKWDGAAGTLRVFVRVPSWACASAAFRFFVYYGKSGLGASEENVAGTWQGASLVVDPTTGTDLTGKGHALTRTGTITNTTLDGRPAAQVADQTGGYLRRTNADLTFLDGLAALTETFWAKIGTASSGNVVRLGGTVGGTARFSVWAEATGSTTGTAAKVLQAGANWWNGATQPNESTESIANIADGSTVRHLLIVRKSNQHTTLYDGETDISNSASGYLNAPSAGTIHPLSTDNYSLGAGTGKQNTSPAMTLGLYALWPFAFSATRRALADRLQRDGSLVACLGDVDLVGDANHGPAGVTFRQAITAQTSIDFQGHAYDPDAGATIVATAVTPASDSSATYAIVSGALRVTPIAGVTGTGRPVVTISDGTKASKISPRLAIIGTGPPPTGYYKTPNHLTAGKTARTAASRTALDTLIGQFASGTYSAATSYIQITGDIGASGTQGSDIVVNAGGTQAHPLVITMAGAGTNDWSSRPSIYNSSLSLTRPWTWVYGVRCQLLPTANATWNTTGGHACVRVRASNQFVTACRLQGSLGVALDKDDLPLTGPTVNYNWFDIKMQSLTANQDPADAAFLTTDAANDVAQAFTFAFNYIGDYATQMLQSKDFRTILSGSGHKDSGRIVSAGSEVAWNFTDASVTVSYEFKHSLSTLHHNHVERASGIAYAGLNLRGNNCDGPTSGTRPLMFANRVKAQHWYCEGTHWDYVSNIHTGGPMNLLPHGTNTNVPKKKDIGGADGCRYVGHKGAFLVGDTSFEPKNYSYGNLGSSAPVLFSASDASCTWVDNAGASIGFSGDPGTATGNHPNVTESAISRQSALVAGITLGTPPVLTASTTGPGVAGLTWAG